MEIRNKTGHLSTAPLPFQGQKKNFIKQFKSALEEFRAKGGITTVVDLFGGSGLLAHVAKRCHPDLRVIYNDYDDYHLRLGSIDTTNEILRRLRKLTADVPDHARIDGKSRDKILQMIGEYDGKGFADYITLSSSLLFSCNYVTSLGELKKVTLYNNIKQSDYKAEGYLDGIEVRKQCYKTLFAEFRSVPSVLFVVDPPYLSTDTRTYSSDKYWKLKDYLDVLHVLSHGNYIYFTSNKSQIIELCDWFADNYGLATPFSNSAVLTHQVKGKVVNYTDMMLVKRRE